METNQALRKPLENIKNLQTHDANVKKRKGDEEEVKKIISHNENLGKQQNPAKKEKLDAPEQLQQGNAEKKVSMEVSDVSLDSCEILEDSITDEDEEIERFHYQNDVLEWLWESERKPENLPQYNLILNQKHITESMRKVLVDWLIQIGVKYQFHSQTIFLAVNYLDRFLSKLQVSRERFQLLGTTVLFLAAKYEEVIYPSSSEFAYLTNDTYKRHQVLQMEKIILNALNFNMTTPTTLDFLSLFTTQLKTPQKVKRMAQYLCELSMLYIFPAEPLTLPSKIASASILLATLILEEKYEWLLKFESVTKYDWKEIANVVLKMSEIHNEAPKIEQQSTQDKFNTSHYNHVSMISPKQLTKRDLEKIFKF